MDLEYTSPKDFRFNGNNKNSKSSPVKFFLRPCSVYYLFDTHDLGRGTIFREHHEIQYNRYITGCGREEALLESVTIPLAFLSWLQKRELGLTVLAVITYCDNKMTEATWPKLSECLKGL